MDLNFEQLLAQHNQEFKEAEVFSNWMPPDAEYIVSLIKLDKGSTVKAGVNLLWWKLTGRIEDVQDEKLNGKEFTVGYYTSRAFGILKGAVQMLTGEQIDDLAQAHAILEASLGKVIRAKVATSKSKKDGKDYTNCYIQEVIDTSVAEAPAKTADDAEAAIPAAVDVAPEAQAEPDAVPAMAEVPIAVPGDPPPQMG